ncbi:MAG: ABC transporter ATP-binding protein/permease [Oscillospiraceae bacterium]|nr:ABC transporter ATP-binding protein/permease [Oscillospiraceae bacterium]
MIRQLIKAHAKTYALGMALLVACVYVQSLAPIALGRAVDALSAEAIDTGAVGRCALAIIAIAVGAFILRTGWRFLIIGGSRHMERGLRERLCQKFQAMPVGFYHRRRSGDLMAYAINDIGAVRMAFGPGIAQMISGVSSTIFALLSMTGVVHPWLTLAALLPVPVAAFCILHIGALVRERFRSVQAQFAVLSGHVNENIMGMRVIKTFVQEEAQERLYDGESEEMMRLNIRLVRASAAMSPLTQALFGISFAVSIFYGGSLVRGGVITLGAFTTFNAYLLMIMQPVVAMGRIVNMLQRGIASMRRLNEIFAEPGIPPEEMTEDTTVQPGQIRAEHLNFRYQGAEENALTDISFSLKKGGTLGIVGPTGCGKSTLLNLIMKFYDSPAGALFIGGRDITAVPAFAIREKTGYVSQEGFLFSGTLQENIAFYQPGADEAAVRAAADRAGLTVDLEQLPDGLQTRVGERGSHVSGGQRQRISLARALIRDPELLLLDDTLSAVDNHTQAQMLASLSEYRAHCSTVIVSHKLSAVAAADEILYLERGRVAERGTHADLLALGGRYADLWAKQQGEEAAS